MIKQKKLQKHLISLIVPAYKQARTIRKDLDRINRVLQQIRYNYEIIVVVDGDPSTLRSAKKMESNKVKIIGYKENRGKGYAIRFGMTKAKGDILAFIDSGMDINPNGLSMLLEHFEWYDADIIIGSKLHPVSKVNYPFQRKIISWGYRTLVRIFFGLSVRDTQVGLKLFRRKVLEDVLPRLLVKKYAIDIELLAVSRYLGYKRIFEGPVEIEFKNISTISSLGFWRTIFLMLWDTLAVFYRLRILHYYDYKNKRNWINIAEFS